MKIAIIGAGISGLSLARMLQNEYEVEVLESTAVIGGIARTKSSNGISYHKIGGHCFNSKHQDVLDFVFNTVMPENEWHKIKRVAKIDFHDNLISYPIEFSIKEIEEFDSELAFKITKEMFNVNAENKETLDEWFISHFGKTLAKEYFIPYNKKIWQCEPNKMSSSWVADKLPIPSKYDFYKSLITEQLDSMPHSYFYYPNTNNQNTFIERMADSVNCTLNYEVTSVQKNKTKWIINNDKEYDIVINTSPLDRLVNLLENVPDDIKVCFSKLKYNKVTNVLWETKNIENTWAYFPSSKTKFHRHINIGSFYKPCKNYCITEVMGDVDRKTIEREGEKYHYLLKAIDYNVSEHAYVVFDKNYNNSIKEIKKYLDDINLITHGRFGEWEYYNMDICIKQSIELAKKIKEKVYND